NHHVLDADGRAGQSRLADANVHDLVGEDAGFLGTENPVTDIQQGGGRLLGHVAVDHVEADALGHDVPNLAASRSGLHQAGGFLDAPLLVLDHIVHTYLDAGVQVHFPGAQGTHHFLGVGEHTPLTLGVYFFAADVVKAQHHILSRYDDRFTVGRRQDVVGGHHQRPGLQLGFQGQRHVYRHLVAVEVRVEGGTDQRVQLNRLAFDQYRFERLDTQAVQGRRTVEHHRVLANHFGEDVPHLGGFALDHLLGRLDGGGQA